MSERIAVVETNKSVQLLEGLPLSADVNLQYVAKLIPTGADIGMANEIISGRFEHLQKIRREAGAEEFNDIDFGLVIALVDDEVFEIAIEEALADVENKEVADHEIGHSLVAESLGWKTKSITVVPGSSYRGLTEAVPGSELSFDDFALEFAAICYGGTTAASIVGNEIHGEGSDLAKVRGLARAVVQNPYSKFASEESFLRQAQNLSHSSLSRHGASGIHKQARLLSHKKTIA